MPPPPPPGTLLVGQQHPLVRVFAPGSELVQNVKDNRLFCYVSRELRSRENKIKKKVGEGECACACSVHACWWAGGRAGRRVCA